jgi:hypothetical protein
MIAMRHRSLKSKKAKRNQSRKRISINPSKQKRKRTMIVIQKKCQRKRKSLCIQAMSSLRKECPRKKIKIKKMNNSNKIIGRKNPKKALRKKKNLMSRSNRNRREGLARRKMIRSPQQRSITDRLKLQILKLYQRKLQGNKRSQRNNNLSLKNRNPKTKSFTLIGRKNMKQRKSGILKHQAYEAVSVQKFFPSRYQS